jgi:transposase-like protein
MTSTQTERREVWRQRISKQEKSGQSVRAFCQAQGVGEHSFYMWRQRLQRETAVSFALVEAKRQPEPPMLELVLRSGDRLRIPSDKATLRTVLAALREPV